MRKKQLLATLVMLSLMQGSVYAAEDKAYDGVNSSKSIFYVNEDGNVEYNNVTVSNSTISGTATSAIDIKHAKNSKQNFTANEQKVVNLTFSSNLLEQYGVAFTPYNNSTDSNKYTVNKITVDGVTFTNSEKEGTIGASGGGLYLNNTNFSKPIESISIQNIENNNSQGKYHGIKLLNGSLGVNSVVINGVSALKGDSYGLWNQGNDFSVGKLTISSIAGNNAYGIQTSSGASITSNSDESIIKVETIKGTKLAYGVKSSSDSWNTKGLEVNGVTSSEGSAYGVDLKNGITDYISSNNITGHTAAYGVKIGDGSRSNGSLDSNLLKVDGVYLDDQVQQGEIYGVTNTYSKQEKSVDEIYISNVKSENASEAYGFFNEHSVWKGDIVSVDGVTSSVNGTAIGIGTQATLNPQSSSYANNSLEYSYLSAKNISGGEAYGLKHYAHQGPSNISSSHIYIADITGQDSAIGILNEKSSSGDAILSISLSDNSEFENNGIVYVGNVTAEVGKAYGILNKGTFNGIKQTIVSGIYGQESAVAVFIDGGKYETEKLHINDIDSENFVAGLVLNDVASEKVTSAYINVNKDNVKGYAGHFLDEMVDDNNDDKADITRVALRVNDGATVDWQAGGYEIYGAIVAGKGDENAAGAGNITISGDNNKIYGDIFAGNGGTINLNQGAGSVFEGQIDDYHELGTSLAGNTFHNSAFDINVTTAGSVDLTLANDATWIARGQSYLSDLTNNGLVDMSQNENSSVTVSKLSGDGTIKMLLNAENKGSSDMLYVTDSVSGTQTIEVDWANTAGVEALKAGDRLRFATTNGDVEHLNARTTDAGFFNVRYTTSTDEYSAAEESEENKLYNSEGNGQGSYKPGNEFANETFDGTGTNHYILGIDDSKSEISDAGQTIINMSRANYSNAIYMDRLNKRMGEARYINPEDEQGMWVRLRHDRIGKEDAFRSQNTMYEMGYDVKQDCDNGDRRVGFAIDYMDGKTEYRNVAGDGDIKRYGLWLYDTWMGEKATMRTTY